MAFPAVAGQFLPTADNATGGSAATGSTGATSHAVTLPATVNAGDLLMVFGRCMVAGTVAVTGGGWTIVQDSSDGSDDVTFWMYRDTLADGSEDSTTITVTHGNGKLVTWSLSISGAEDPATQAPETSTVQVGASTTPGPNVCTPTGGAKDYLWLWAAGWDGEQTLNKTAPTNYTDMNDASTGTASTVNGQGKMGWRQLNAASTTAGGISLSAAPLGWTAWLIAVHPAAGGTVNTETGSLTAGTVAAAADVHENVEAGSLTVDTAAAAADAHEAVRAGSLTAGTVAAAADVHEAARTGALTSRAFASGVQEFVPSGPTTNEETGSLTAGTITAAADSHENVEAGTVSTAVQPRAADSHENVEAGALTAATQPRAADSHENVETGAAPVGTVLSGVGVKVGAGVFATTGSLTVRALPAGVSQHIPFAIPTVPAAATVADTFPVGVSADVAAGAAVSVADVSAAALVTIQDKEP